MDKTFDKADKEIKILIESIYDGILIADKDFIVRYANESYLNIAGLQRTDIVGKNVREVRPGSVLPEVIKSGKGKINIFRHVGNSDYIVDMSPIIVNNKILGGISLVKSFKQLKKLAHELENHIKQNQELKETVNRLYQAKYNFEDAIGDSPIFKKTIVMAKRIAEYDEDVLITGESGTGKELFAQSIHNDSMRKNKIFVAVNCSTFNETLIESELFGYTSGSFTGALKGGKIGLFKFAEGGTILLDEIGELPYGMQAKLLRVLQERKIRRIGEFSEEDINVRVIAATNKNLSKLVQEGLFREDLYYRLSAITLDLPPLRERKEDLEALANHFLKLWSEKRKKPSMTIDETIYKHMEEYSWPGNVRELRNVIQFSAYTCDSNVIKELNMPKFIRKNKTNNSVNTITIDENVDGSLKDMLNEHEKKIIEIFLNKYGNSLEAKKAIAEELKISLATFYNKIKQYNL